MARVTLAAFRNRNQRIVDHPVHRICGHFSGQCAVAYPAESVNVRPRPLIASARILLARRVSRRHNGRYRTALGPYRHARRAKVQQHGRIVLGSDDDVARLDVTMQKISPMHHLQAVENRVQNRFEFCLGQDALAVEKLRQGLALGVFHHDIRRAVRLKKMMHAHDVRMLKPRQNSGFVDKALQAPLKIRRRLRRLRHHAPVAFAGGEVRRQVLLDRHGNI